jgi:3-hydroxyisobutyrate dehydrogenase
MPSRQLPLVSDPARALEPRRPRLEPIFEPLARQILWLDRVGDASRLKIALNNWLAVLVEGMAETLTLAGALGLDPHLFVTTIAGGPLTSRYATDKAITMLDADFTPGFPLQHAAKDAALAAEAAYDHGLELPLTAALLDRWHRAIAAGHGQDDVASTITVAVDPTTDTATSDTATAVVGRSRIRGVIPGHDSGPAAVERRVG